MLNNRKKQKSQQVYLPKSEEICKNIYISNQIGSKKTAFGALGGNLEALHELVSVSNLFINQSRVDPNEGCAHAYKEIAGSHDGSKTYI